MLADTAPRSRRSLVGFPPIVNEIAARTVAAGVVAMTLLYLVTGSGWVLVPLAYGFVARVVAGPTLSPLGRLATQVIVPALPFAERPVPGPPKRFAQAIGATLSSAAAVAHIAGNGTAAVTLVAMITFAAGLESAAGYCLGCKMFGLAMRAGLVRDDICEACNDLSKRPGFAAAAASSPAQWTY